jgi:Fe-S-cluster containining protein
VTTFWLSTHVRYACRHSGACCTAGWPIPIERDRAAAVKAAIGAGQILAPPLWHSPTSDAPEEVAGVLTRRRDGSCVFHRLPPPRRASAWAGGCAIHAHRPAACRHFPYICVIDARGVHVTLSHFCPTAASLLFDEGEDVSIVEGPPVPVGDAAIEGLDARESLPPIDPQSTSAPKPPGTRRPMQLGAPAADLRLLSWDAVTRWEQALVQRLAGDAEVPDAPRASDFDAARAAVGPGWSWPAAPERLADAWRSLVAPAWSHFPRVVGRYLAARAHASWAAYLGDGLADVERMVALSRTVLQVEACRACLARRSPLDRPVLTNAIRQADLLLMHYADPYRLNRVC